MQALRARGLVAAVCSAWIVSTAAIVRAEEPDRDARVPEPMEETAEDRGPQPLPAEEPAVSPEGPDAARQSGQTDEIGVPEGERSRSERSSARDPRRPPRWMWVGLGVGGGVLVLGTVGAVVSSAWLTAPETRSFGFRPELIEAGRATSNPSASDPGTSSNPSADDGAFFEVNPDELPPYVDICEYNTHDFTKGSSGLYSKGASLVAADGTQGSRNAEVAEICDRGKTVRKVQMGMTGVALVGLAATGTFATLLIIHHVRARRADSAWQRRGLALELGPAPGQGLVVGLRGRL